MQDEFDDTASQVDEEEERTPEQIRAENLEKISTEAKKFAATVKEEYGLNVLYRG